MKRGKDDEKVMGPMFPRLHVNDTEKGGPRAPPRNKMALYEQFSIPSQRFTRPGMMPNSNANFVPPAISSPGNEHEMSTFSPIQVPPRNPAEEPTSHYLDPNAPLKHLGQEKNLSEDDHEVPSFIYSEGVQECGKYNNGTNMENLSPYNPTHSEYSIKPQGALNEEPKKIGDRGVNAEQLVKRRNASRTRDTVDGRKLAEDFSFSQSMDVARDLIKQAHMSFSHELRGASPNNFRRLQRPDSRSQPEQSIVSQPECKKDGPLNTKSTDKHREIFSMPVRKFPSDERINLEDVINNTGLHEDRPCQSLQANNEDHEDDASDTSMVDSVSGVDISPDDVVGIIGQNHFWKARRAIVNQQRVFAVQVFELHRLIKVQRLIAKSPHLLEDNAYFGEPIKAAPVRKLPLDYIVKAPSNVSKQKSDKPNNQMECSAEDTIGKASLSSVQNGSQPLNNGSSARNAQSAPIASDPNMGPWGFHYPQGHHWLVPVMSPTEGLVYKPYQGPGFTSPVCGGCGPPGPTPMMGNFLPPGYGVPGSHHQYQGIGGPTFVPPAGPHGYFPPYGMSIMNPGMPAHGIEQTSQFTTHGLQRQLSGGGANFSVQHQNSPTPPDPKGGSEKGAPKLNVPKESELQVSTASSPTERARDALNNSIRGSNVLPLFPTSPVIEVRSSSPGHHEDDQTTRVIRVVPHNRRSATESAARIFQSIQRERKQYESG